MKSHSFTKLFLITTVAFISYVSSACWYKYFQFNDYIFGINNFENHTIVEYIDDKSGYQYTVKNNQIVDLPISVSINLEHNQNVSGDINSDDEIYCALQYRILPSGTWQTVAERIFAANTIKEGAIPAFYLGRNNICPQGLEKDDVIMIRVYVERGITVSGDIEDLCGKTLIDNMLSNEYQYTFRDKEHSSTLYDLGGNWLPHLVTTVIFSGKYRPVR